MREILRVHTLHQHDLLMPNNEILHDDPSYVFVPLRGLCSILAVFDNDDKLIGWINTRSIGYESAGAWMNGEGWIDHGY